MTDFSKFTKEELEKMDSHKGDGQISAVRTHSRSRQDKA